MEPATVAEIIEALQKLPPNLPCYFRPKYSGTVEYSTSVPVNKNGIVKMESHTSLAHANVTFLC